MAMNPNVFFDVENSSEMDFTLVSVCVNANTNRKRPSHLWNCKVRSNGWRSNTNTKELRPTGSATHSEVAADRYLDVEDG